MRRKGIDLTGREFGKLTVIKQDGRNVQGRVMWLCQCSCGKQCHASTGDLCSGDTQSCGCLKDGHPKHGMVYTSTYEIWCGMKKRCTDSKSKSWKNYGGRGITICEKWKTFEGFFDDMGERPDGLSIDRIDNNKGYYKENCRWTNLLTQANNRRSNHPLTYLGKTQSLHQWAKEFNLSYSTLCARITNYKWPIEKSLTEPLHPGRHFQKD